MNIDATLDLTDAQRRWDTVVVGAGPSGSLAARELARRGASVLLVDKSRFPRAKVCGCCINARAVAILASVGLSELIDRCGARPLCKLHLAARGCRAELPIAGRALSRESFDAALVKEAIHAGAHILPETLARPVKLTDDGRALSLRRGGTEVLAFAAVVLGADGLGGRLLADEPDHQACVAADSRLGAGVVARHFPGFYEEGRVFMACGTGGYVGLVRLEDGRLNLAAAFDGQFVKKRGGTGKAAAAILDEAGLPAIDGLDELDWHGTPLLTRSMNPPAAERMFLIGDAAGYQEPFTGEGMSWALECAVAVVPLAMRTRAGWSDAYVRPWARIHRQSIARRQWICRAAAQVLRRPRLVRFIVHVLGRFPWLAGPALRSLGFNGL